MAAPDTGDAVVHRLITKGLRGRPRSEDALDLSSSEKAQLLADIIGSESKISFERILPGMSHFPVIARPSNNGSAIEQAETAQGIVILLHHEREHLKSQLQIAEEHEREHLKSQLQIAEEQGKHVQLEHKELESFLTLILKGETLQGFPLAAEPEDCATPSDQPDVSSVELSESKLAEALPIASSVSHGDSDDSPTADSVEVAVNGRQRSASGPPSPTTAMSTATASPTESTGHRTPVGQTRPLPPQQFFKRQQLRRLSTGSARTIEEPTGKASGSQSAIITTRRLSDEITGPAKGWSNGKPPWSREGALLVRSSTAPSLFMDRRPSLPTSASMERLHGSQASSSSPSSKGESPTYKGWPFFRQPDHDPDEALSNHRRRPSNSLMLHSRRDSASSVTSATRPSA
ncbi:uncharacterized protein LOC62_02G002174 [Vanrija pseudolonga]|uniref:Uncharacterized protein n=1 Tax=Vanrija pseudolonga TaxID=143232 RepID=A0AAF0Y3B4_9TREE|nr:hypothetical protein LOC62_02G002174 [Vanrija pseudolonga]